LNKTAVPNWGRLVWIKYHPAYRNTLVEGRGVQHQPITCKGKPVKRTQNQSHPDFHGKPTNITTFVMEFPPQVWWFKTWLAQLRGEQKRQVCTLSYNVLNLPFETSSASGRARQQTTRAKHQKMPILMTWYRNCSKIYLSGEWKPPRRHYRF
jgi:hypothetical protein